MFSNRKPLKPSQLGVLHQVYHVTRPLDQPILDVHPTLAQLEHVVLKINQGQAELERLRRLEESFLYRSACSAWGACVSLFGYSPRRIDPIDLFSRQQASVRQLNNILAYMSVKYQEDLAATRRDLDGLLDAALRDEHKKRDLDARIPGELKGVQHAREELEALRADDDREKYYEKMKRHIALDRVARGQRLDYTLVTIARSQYGGSISNVWMQEQIFKTMLDRVMEMACKTELYQRSLDHNVRVWRAIGDLATAVRAVGGSMHILSDFSKQLNATYMSAVRDIQGIIDSHPGQAMIASANHDLRQLLDDVHQSAYRSALLYETPEAG